MQTLNLHQLATFQVVAKHCSYVRAAEELHFSQPAVSAQIRQLEEALGVKLFEQIGRKTYLTEAGEQLHTYSLKIFSVIDETLETMEKLRSPDFGRLRVGADTTVGTYVIPGLLGKFHQSYPEVEISLDVVNRAALVERIMSNQIDIAIVGRVPDDIPVVIEPFLPNELVIVATPFHRLAGRVNMAAGLGIALISRVALDMELDANRLVILDVEGFPIMRQWRIVHLKDKHLSATALTFKAFLLEHADRRLRRKEQ